MSTEILSNFNCAAVFAGITIDVEGHIQSGGSDATAVLDALTNATAQLRAAPELGLRFSAAVQISWAFHPVVYPPGTPPRPGHEAVMDVVDEAIVMAYYNGCNDPLSAPSAPCDSSYALWWSAPWLLYANTVRLARNETRLVTIGVAAADPRSNTTAATPRMSSELEIETYFNQTLTAMHVLEGFGPEVWHAKGYAPGNFILTDNLSHAPHGNGGFHQFAIFDAASYFYVTSYGAPCPRAEPVCHGADGGKRPRRALWAYTSHDQRNGLGGDVVSNVTAQNEYLSWCSSHGVTELYLMESCMEADTTRRNATEWSWLHRFVHAADQIGVDVQLYGGEMTREIVPCTVGGIAFAREHAQLEHEGEADDDLSMRCGFEYCASAPVSLRSVRLSLDYRPTWSICSRSATHYDERNDSLMQFSVLIGAWVRGEHLARLCRYLCVLQHTDPQHIAATRTPPRRRWARWTWDCRASGRATLACEAPPVVRVVCSHNALVLSRDSATASGAGGVNGIVEHLCQKFVAPLVVGVAHQDCAVVHESLLTPATPPRADLLRISVDIPDIIVPVPMQHCRVDHNLSIQKIVGVCEIARTSIICFDVVVNVVTPDQEVVRNSSVVADHRANSSRCSTVPGRGASRNLCKAWRDAAAVGIVN